MKTIDATKHNHLTLKPTDETEYLINFGHEFLVNIMNCTDDAIKVDNTGLFESETDNSVLYYTEIPSNCTVNQLNYLTKSSGELYIRASSAGSIIIERAA